jgi:glycine hydroxymethyltransferase
MCLIDCKSYKSPSGIPLNGDMGARILDLVGIVVNRNTIPGDRSALSSTGIRIGATWLTQRGFVEKDFTKIADLIHEVFSANIPYHMIGRSGKLTRAKVDFSTIGKVSTEVRAMADTKPAMDDIHQRHGYPHYFYLQDHPRQGIGALMVTGENVRAFLNYTLTSDDEYLEPGYSQLTMMHTTDGDIEGILTCNEPKRFTLTVPAEKLGLAGSWLVGISSAFIYYDPDLTLRIPGPISIQKADPVWVKPKGERVDLRKPYFVGMPSDVDLPSLPEFVWVNLKKMH